MIKYIHNKNLGLIKEKRSTVALELPDPEEMIKCAQYFTEFGNTYISLNYGIALVHPKDQFNKKIGREQSQLKMIPVPTEIISLTINNNHMTMCLCLISEEHSVYISLRLYFDSKKVRIIRYS